MQVGGLQPELSRYGMSCEDAQDKYDWRLKIKGETG